MQARHASYSNPQRNAAEFGHMGDSVLHRNVSMCDRCKYKNIYSYILSALKNVLWLFCVQFLYFLITNSVTLCTRYTVESKSIPTLMELTSQWMGWGGKVNKQIISKYKLWRKWLEAGNDKRGAWPSEKVKSMLRPERGSWEEDHSGRAAGPRLASVWRVLRWKKAGVVGQAWSRERQTEAK